MADLSITAKEYIRAFDSRYDVTDYTGNSTIIYGGTGGSGELNQEKGQSFIAGGSSIKSIWVYTWDDSTNPSDDLIVDITTSIGGTSLGSATVTYGGISTFGYTDFNFSSPISVTSGTRYFIQLKRSGTRDTSSFWRWILNFQSTDYADILPGETLYKKDNNVWAVDSNTSTVNFKIDYADNPTVHIPSLIINKSETITIEENNNRSSSLGAHWTDRSDSII